MNRYSRPLALFAAIAFLGLPWVQPFVPGPTPSVGQWLLVWGAALVWYAITHRYGLGCGEIGEVLAFAWVVAAAFSAMAGLLQYFGLTAFSGKWINSADIGQAFANLRQRNQLATLLAIGVAAWMYLESANGRPKLLTLVGRVSAALVLASAAVATGSRTGFFQMLLLALLARWWGRRSTVLLSAGVGYLVAAWLLPQWAGLDPLASGILGRVGESTAACTSRLTLWSNVLHLIAQKPWFGWGWGELDYAHFITLYPGERFCEILDNAHNLPLHLAVELGVPVALVLCATCCWLVWRSRPWAETNPTRQLAWGVLAVIGLHSMLEYPLWYGPFQLAVVLCIWMLWVTRMNADADEPGSVPPRESTKSSALAIAVATILIAACAYAAWDYWRISQIYLAPESRNAAYRDDTLAKIQNSWLFQDQVKFAELTITPLTQDNAGHTYELAKDMLHFSPEPRVVEKVIESATMLGRDEEALFYLQRFKAAFPEQHSRWSAALKIPEQD